MTDFEPLKSSVYSLVIKSKGALAPALIFMAGLLIMPQSVYAACKGIDCACLPSELQFASPTIAPGENGKFPISLEADNVEAEGQELVTLSGNAEVKQGRKTIVADQIKYYRDSDRVVAKGNVEMITDRGDYISSQEIDVYAPTQIGSLTNSQFKLAQSIDSDNGIDTVKIESRGSAGEINLEGENLFSLKDALYTNCPEGNNSVYVSGGALEIDRAAGVGKARNALVRFKGVPIFYAPYISFPINDERKTGFLTPGFGSDEESGEIFEFPWFWNIAKNQDMTITPRYYTDRGTQVGIEYRRKSNSSQTYVYGEYLPEDDLFEGESRDMLSISHSQDFTENLSGRINFNDVSDSQYFEDLRNGIRYFSASFVPQEASLTYSADYFTLKAFAKEYVIVDSDINEERQPYERLPVVSLSTKFPKGPWGIKYGIDANYSDFSSDFRLEGTRTAITPYVSLPLSNIWGEITPKISFNHRSYSLDNVEEGQEDSPSFSVPIFSLDTKVVFEKNTSWFGDGALQTLEPRLFYVYAPEEDQDDVPLFDTGLSSLNSKSGIFRENRFNGYDRVGDTNQVTLSVTTKITDNETGDQRLKASIGQLYLIDDLEVGLDENSEIIESGLGDLFAELSTYSKGAWTTSTFVRYDHELSEIRSASFEVGYEPEDNNRKKIAMDYYYSKSPTTENETEQVILSANWPISDRWSFYGYERYSIDDSESLETTLGVEYNACCWKLRFTGQERVQNTRNVDDDDKRQSFFIELELTSLGSIRTGLQSGHRSTR